MMVGGGNGGEVGGGETVDGVLHGHHVLIDAVEGAEVTDVTVFGALDGLASLAVVAYDDMLTGVGGVAQGEVLLLACDDGVSDREVGERVLLHDGCAVSARGGACHGVMRLATGTGYDEDEDDGDEDDGGA